jgi:hemin uptake protein HemP
MKKIVFWVMAIVVLNSCSHRKVEIAIAGWWSIDTIYYKKHDLKYCLTDRAMFLKFGKTSALPVTSNNCIEIIKNSYNKSAEITLLNSADPNDTIPYRLRIVSENEIFKGNHKIIFYNDEPNQLLKMEIFSDSLYVLCRKGMFNHSENIALIKELEDMTWTTHPR